MFNRKALNKLVNASNELYANVKDIYRFIKRIDHEIVFSMTIHQINALYQLLSDTISDTFRTLEELKDQIVQAMHGKLSMSLIKPKLLMESLN